MIPGTPISGVAGDGFSHDRDKFARGRGQRAQAAIDQGENKFFRQIGDGSEYKISITRLVLERGQRNGYAIALAHQLFQALNRVNLLPIWSCSANH